MALKKTGGMEMKGNLCAGTFFRIYTNAISSYAVHYKVFDALVSVHVGLQL